MTASYLVEAYLARLSPDLMRSLVVRAGQAADELTAGGMPVRHLRSIFVPDDESCFHLFEGSAAAVAEASSRALTAFERIVPAIELGASSRRGLKLAVSPHDTARTAT